MLPGSIASSLPAGGGLAACHWRRVQVQPPPTTQTVVLNAFNRPSSSSFNRPVEVQRRDGGDGSGRRRSVVMAVTAADGDGGVRQRRQRRRSAALAVEAAAATPKIEASTAGTVALFVFAVLFVLVLVVLVVVATAVAAFICARRFICVRFSCARRRGDGSGSDSGRVE